MNWGTKILLLYVSFLLFILTMVFLSMREQIDLVAPDYYARELAFQEKIDAGKNSLDDSANWELSLNDREVKCAYSKKTDANLIKGTILFFRSSDAGKDMSREIRLNPDGVQSFDLADFSKGAYQVIIDWKVDGKNYYQQKNIFIP